ncbi:MAG: tRNA pseudouridine(38-40) synthase TruA [Sulfurimonas sp.]|nr:MAG: tRNA pseudouridine(38-40) synthase TruA [Sulfurimonas sp.]
MRCKLTLSYNGAHFMGSQQQSSTEPTVTGTLIKALEQLNISSTPVASGRTDRGVHATAQVLHVDLPPYWNNLEKLQRALSFQLPSSMHIKKIEAVNNSFHARYSAVKRRYRYILSTKKPNPFEADLVTFIPEIDFQRLQDAITLFEGTHNFEMFKKNGSVNRNFERTIYKTRAYRHKHYLILTFEANGFLRSQIRMMVYGLLEIAKGHATTRQLTEQLACQKRHFTHLAPHCGLYLSGIKYHSQN